MKNRILLSICIIIIYALGRIAFRPLEKVLADSPNADLVGSLTVASGATTAATPYTFAHAGTHICLISTQTATASVLSASGPLVPQVTSTTLNVQFANAVASATVVGYICHGTF